MRFGKLLAVYRSSRAYSAGTAGLFNKAQLQSPSDWVTYAQDAIRRYCSMWPNVPLRIFYVVSYLYAGANPLLSKQ